MASEGEYELLPHEEIQKLRDELDKLKKNPLGTTDAAKDLQTSVSDLTKAINSLTKLLTQTNDELTDEFQRTSITEQFAQISAQNEQIAQGILTVAQLVQQPAKPAAPNVSSDSSVIAAAHSTEVPLMQQSQQPINSQPMPSMEQETQFQTPQDPFGEQPIPPMNQQPPQMGFPNSPPPLDLPPAPEKKKGGLMGMFH